MSIKAELNLGDDGKGNLVKVSGEFSDSEFDQLSRYEQYVGELTETEILRKGAPGKLTINYDKTSGFNFVTELPPDDKLSALLHELRPFILQNEDTNFYKIQKILGKRFENDQFRSFLKSIRKYYQGEKITGMISITANGKLVNGDALVSTWLNAYEYHRDQEKREEMEKVSEVFPFEATRALLVMILYDKVDAIFIIANVIRVLLGKQTGFVLSNLGT